IAVLFLLFIVIKFTLINQSNVAKIKELQEAKKPTDTPPILVIEDKPDIRFTLGSAEISPSMQKFLQTKVIPEIENHTKKYQIDVVEIIGHTDGTINSKYQSNLDDNLEKAAKGDILIKDLKPGSNADLGLIRALAVVKELQKSTVGKNLKFRAYSAGQLILQNGEFAPVNREDDTNRRRIEIRLRLGKDKKMN
ncbi:MAG TPA: hypothetical protein V6C58_08235, partial [Allocoleopsis sp.]